MPAAMVEKVDFPDPFSPMRPTTWPRLMAKLTLTRAFVGPKLLLMPSARRIMLSALTSLMVFLLSSFYVSIKHFTKTEYIIKCDRRQ